MTGFALPSIDGSFISGAGTPDNGNPNPHLQTDHGQPLVEDQGNGKVYNLRATGAEIGIRPTLVSSNPYVDLQRLKRDVASLAGTVIDEKDIDGNIVLFTDKGFVITVHMSMVDRVDKAFTLEGSNGIVFTTTLPLPLITVGHDRLGADAAKIAIKLCGIRAYEAVNEINQNGLPPSTRTRASRPYVALDNGGCGLLDLSKK